MSWNFDNSKPIYSQIEEEIKKLIFSGKLAKGEKMKSVRELAQEAGVNPNTMQKALSEIERQGLIVTERTNGRFVTTEETILKGLKKDFLDDKIPTLLRELRSLGYEKTEIHALIDKYFQEVDDSDK